LAPVVDNWEWAGLERVSKFALPVGNRQSGEEEWRENAGRIVQVRTKGARTGETADCRKTKKEDHHHEDGFSQNESGSNRLQSDKSGLDIPGGCGQRSRRTVGAGSARGRVTCRTVVENANCIGRTYCTAHTNRAGKGESIDCRKKKNKIIKMRTNVP
jgi:hypothetical protein